MCNLRNASSKESQVLGSPPYQKKFFKVKLYIFVQILFSINL